MSVQLMMKSLLLVLIAILTVRTNASREHSRMPDVSRMLKDMVNQTNSQPMELPANATSIRPNITDNFSCENRTYGYYADVENDCQIFHVCLPSQSASGRNHTYKWSFICPNETIFNQVVLVCTRPIDSIPCEDSEMYYDVNDEFGKTNDTQMANDTQTSTEQYSQPMLRNREKRNEINKVKLNLPEKHEHVPENASQLTEVQKIAPAKIVTSSPINENVNIEPEKSPEVKRRHRMLNFRQHHSSVKTSY